VLRRLRHRTQCSTSAQIREGHRCVAARPQFVSTEDRLLALNVEVSLVRGQQLLGRDCSSPQPVTWPTVRTVTPEALTALT